MTLPTAGMLGGGAGGGGGNQLDLNMSSTATSGNTGSVYIGGSTISNGTGSLSTFKLILIGGAVLAGLYLWKRK